jgi:hypothetical protein
MGIGETGLPIRVNCPPEVIFLELNGVKVEGKVPLMPRNFTD